MIKFCSGWWRWAVRGGGDFGWVPLPWRERIERGGGGKKHGSREAAMEGRAEREMSFQESEK